MADINEKENGIEAISDDELDAAAGGMRIFANDDEEKWAREKAAADGRTLMLKPGSWMCVCSHKYKFAKSRGLTEWGNRYYDVKCYFCNKTKEYVYE